MRFTTLPTRLLAVACLVAVVAVAPAAAQKKETVTSLAGATVYDFPSNGNVTCANLSTDGRFGSVSGDYEFKIDPPPPVGTTAHDLDSIGDDGTMTVTLSSEKVMTFFSLANGPTDPYYAISAVIVKGGNQGTNVYYYPSLTLSDSGSFTVTGGKNAISHISFCLELTIRPSAADGSVSGSVTNRNGGAIYNARVRLTSLATGAVQTAYTNSFGYYRFEALETGDAYNVNVYASGYTFATANATFTLMGDQTVNFVAK
jgi:hypothetical protein